jgi:outer membrane protein OmpA-like peptidoglycan-associated protein
MIAMTSRHAAIIVAGVSVLGIPAVVSAQSLPAGPYVGLGFGANWAEGANAKQSGGTDHFSYDTGWIGALEGGYALGNGLRGGLEFSYRDNSVDHARGTGASGGHGDISNYGLMGNVYYDFATGTPLTPYVGAGVGLGILDSSKQGTVFGSRLDGTDTEFAYQFIGGVAYSLTQQLALTGEYRYYSTLDPHFGVTGSSGARSEYHNHAVLLGLRYTFGEVPAATPVVQPAPAVAPAPQPRSFIVFFDFDKSNLTTTATQVVDSAAQAARGAEPVRIALSGHTDTTGSIAYDQRLSERRVKAVRDALIARGIPADGISTVALGKSKPMVATADDVREPSNRRVEIVIQ